MKFCYLYNPFEDMLTICIFFFNILCDFLVNVSESCFISLVFLYVNMKLWMRILENFTLDFFEFTWAVVVLCKSYKIVMRKIEF